MLLFLSLFQFSGFDEINMITGANGYEVPPVPIPNTEVKLIHAEDT